MYMTENQKIASAYRKMYESSPANRNFANHNHNGDNEDSMNESFFSFRGNNEPDENMTTVFDRNERRLFEEWRKLSSNIKNEYIDNLMRYMAEYVASGRLNENEIKNMLYNALSYSSTDKPYTVLMKLINNTKMRHEYGNGNNANVQSDYRRSYGVMNGNNGDAGNGQNQNPFRIIHLYNKDGILR